MAFRRPPLVYSWPSLFAPRSLAGRAPWGAVRNGVAAKTRHPTAVRYVLRDSTRRASALVGLSDVGNSVEDFAVGFKLRRITWRIETSCPCPKTFSHDTRMISYTGISCLDCMNPVLLCDREVAASCPFLTPRMGISTPEIRWVEGRTLVNMGTCYRHGLGQFYLAKRLHSKTFLPGLAVTRHVDPRCLFVF